MDKLYTYRAVAASMPESRLEIVSSRACGMDTTTQFGHFYVYWQNKGVAVKLITEGLSEVDRAHWIKEVTSRYTVQTVWHGPVQESDDAVRKRLAMRTARLARLSELHAPAIIMERELQLVLDGFARLRASQGYDYRDHIQASTYTAADEANQEAIAAAEVETDRAVREWAGLTEAIYEAMTGQAQQDLYQAYLAAKN